MTLPINVLWVIDHVCYDGSLHGGGRLFWNLLNQFDPSRVRIVACMLRSNDTLRSLFQNAPVPVKILDKGKFDPTTLSAFLDIIRTENIQVMHLHCYASSTFGRLAGLLTGVPTLIHDYDTEVYFPYPSYLKLADKLLAPVTQGAVAASPMVKQFLIDKRNIDPSKIRMMFHAIPEEKFVSPLEKRIQLRRQLGIPEGDQVLGTLTKLGPQRGNQFLIEAYADIARAQPNTALVLMYKLTRFHRLPNKDYVKVDQASLDNAVEELRSLAEKLGVADRVHLIEWPEEETVADEWASVIDLFIAPFLSERFSSVHLLEALAKGQPVVATALGEAAEIIRDGENGYLLPPGDRNALKETVLSVLQSPEQFTTLKAQAQQSAQRYSTQACVTRLQSWYANLVNASTSELDASDTNPESLTPTQVTK